MKKFLLTIFLFISVLTLSACSFTKYTIVFDSVGGSKVENQYVKNGSTITKPTDPTKDGHTFVGWYFNDQEWTFTTPVKDNMTLKAKWNQLEYTITFDSMGGSEVKSQTIKYGEKIKKPTDPTKEGLIFNGWYESNNRFDFSTPVTKDMTLIARWSNEIHNCTVTFDYDNNESNKEVVVNQNEKVNKPTDPTKVGYTFKGWFNNNTLWDFDNNVVKDITLKAIWEINSYTITFNTDGGNEISPIKLDYNSKVTKPKDPTKVGYTFKGWDKEIPTLMPANDLVINAKWQINKYTITFNTNGGNEIPPIKLDYNSNITKPTNPTKPGYTFNGWDKEIPSKMPANDLVINAKWTKNETFYTVKFIGFNNVLLKEETVKEGSSATAPLNPQVNGYEFIGWDKPFTNITTNLTVNAIYEKIDLPDPNKTYNIIYNLNGGSFGYLSKDEYIISFLKDFYNFVSPTESLDTFIYGSSNDKFLGTWKKYIGGAVGEVNKLLYNNDLTLDNNDYFFNSTLYKEKWANLGTWVKGQNNRFAGNNYQYGALDFYRYIITDPAGYESIYGPTFFTYPDLNKPTKLTFKSNETPFDLVIPLSQTFKGWYLDSNFTGSKITQVPKNTNKDIEVYAKWDDTKTYEVYINANNGLTYKPITVEYGTKVTLPTVSKNGYIFDGWYLDNTKLSNPFTFNYTKSITVLAKWKSNELKLVELKYDGTPVKYRGSSKSVMIPDTYIEPDRELRAAWVSSYVDDFTPSTSESTMKNNLTKVLDLLESYNMNCVIFHIRTMNNAFYKTKLAPIDPNYGTYSSFERWDYLTWFISECHKRGMEFHAWLNPYRIKSYGAGSPENIANIYKDYPLNPASKKENVLMSKANGAILNPAKKAVQDYIVNVCLEVMENYDVDAIHFDDYFYTTMAPDDILKQADQSDYINYINNNPNSFNKNSSSDKQDWRRMNIDNFIKKLSQSMRNFNKTHNRKVQLGIAPTGIYKNGNGSISSGSNTAGQEHFASYLFCDTKKWVDNEWIDYILPQSYWGFTHSAAGYADVMDWWNKVVEGKKVNLYSGIGLYMAEPNSNYSWGRQPYEISNQILYLTKLKNVKGVSIFCLKNLRNMGSNANEVAYPGLQRLKNDYWVTKVKTPDSYLDYFLN